MINDVFTQDALINSRFKFVSGANSNLRKDIISTPVRIWPIEQGILETKIADFFTMVKGTVVCSGLLQGTNVSGTHYTNKAIVRFTNTETGETQDIEADIGTGGAIFRFSGGVQLSANTHYEISTLMVDTHVLESAEATELYFSFSVSETSDRYIVSKQKEEL